METLDPPPNLDASPVAASLAAISDFYKTHRCLSVLRRLQALTRTPTRANRRRLVSDCTALAADIDRETVLISTSIAEYSDLLFPDLPLPAASPLPADYFNDLGVERGLQADDNFEDLTTACARASAVAEARKTIFDFAVSNMEVLAPNLCAVVGPSVAAKLVGSAGGLQALSTMTITRILYLGSADEGNDYNPPPRFMMGFGMPWMNSYARKPWRKNQCYPGMPWRSNKSYLDEADICQHVKYDCLAVQERVAEECARAALVDFVESDPEGAEGRQMANGIRTWIQESEEMFMNEIFMGDLMGEPLQSRWRASVFMRIPRRTWWATKDSSRVGETQGNQSTGTAGMKGVKLGVKDSTKFKEKDCRSSRTGGSSTSMESLALALQDIDLKSDQKKGSKDQSVPK